MALDSLDDTVVVWVATHRIDALNPLFTGLGTLATLGLIWVALAAVVGIRRRLGVVPTVILALAAGLSAFAADSACFGLKNAVDRTRPFIAHPEIHPLDSVRSSSFPAGHAATAFAGAVVLSYALVRAAPLFFGLAVAIGFSRVYVGVHYPSDVLAGALIGAAFGAAAVLLLRLAARRVSPARPFAPVPPARG